MYVERVSSSGQMMRVVQAVGTRAPLHATSVGKARQQHRREMENIRQHGPLNRLTERVLTEGEEAAAAEERELRSLADAGDFDALAGRIRGDLEEMGATDDDMAMVDYFRDIVERTQDPAWKRWAVEMALWSRKAAGAARG